MDFGDFIEDNFVEFEEEENQNDEEGLQYNENLMFGLNL